jgi:hypothetical protein
MSLGFPAMAMLDNAVRNSIADGIVYSISSGNDSANACGTSPARVAEAITVNATDAGDNRAAFSNFGECTDIFAPGVNIVSANFANDTGAVAMSGTSMAAPHVAGAAALVLASNPSLNPQQVAGFLYGTATLNLVAGGGAFSPNRLLFVSYPVPASPPAGPDHLIRGQALSANQFIRSANQRFTLYMQSDGNLVLYQDMAVALWSSGTAGHPGAFAVFQPADGNFVVYAPGNVPLRHLCTNGTAANQLVVQSDSNVVMYGDSLQVYWTRGLPLC